MKSPLHLRFLRRSVTAALILGLASLASTAPAGAKGCIEGSPASAPPASLWGELQPQSILNDATNYNGNQLADHKYAQFTAVDVENGYLFASYWSGFGIWDARSTPASPNRLVLIDGWSGSDCRQHSSTFPSWPGCNEFDNWIWALDAPEGDDTFVAVGGLSPVGLAIFDTTNKTTPALRYQDPNVNIKQIYSATIGGRAYAFAADYGTGVFVYDMTAAREGGLSMCLDNAAHNACGAVYKGRLVTVGVQYVHGARIGTRTFVVGSGGFGGPVVRLWDVTTPTAPVAITTGYGSSNVPFGVALWKQGASSYLAVRHSTTLDILDVTACTGTGCTGLPSPLSTVSAPEFDSDFWKPVIFSWSGSSPMLFLGHHDLCHSNETNPPSDIKVDHTEFLFDASNPAGPHDITPTVTLLTHNTPPEGSTTDNGDRTVDYWSWYYSDTARGYAFEAPLGGKFNGDYFYRAARSILDVHKWAGSGPPTAVFSYSPSTFYPGDSVTFTDNSSGGVTSRNWSFQDGNPVGGTTNPISVTFATPGSKLVSLSVVNANGSDSTSQNVTVSNPSPTVSGASASPPSGPVCSRVTWSATGVGGKTPLTITWEVRDGNNASVGTGAGNPFVWNSGTNPAGIYSGTVTVNNAAGPPATAAGTVTLVAPGPLPTSGQFTPANDPFAFATVSFHANVASASEWNWDFGDGAGYRGWTGAYAVADPVFTYTAIGSYNVKVQVRNCIQTTPAESAALAVNVTNVQPLQILQFQASCNVAPCGTQYNVNQPITFNWQVDGNADSCQFDWDGNGTFEQTGVACPNGSGTTDHTYTSTGTFSPKMRAVRGAEHVDATHAALTISTGAPPPTPSVSISGASSGSVGQQLTFNASGTNCTPAASGWTWTYGDGAVSGASNTSSLSVSWPTSGNKSVTAKNSACGTATGTKSVAIGSVNPGGLAASFTFTPATPAVGTSVAFDGSASTGSPTTFSWSFGDGQSTSGTSNKANHTYATGGTYTVKLEVGKIGTGAGCDLGVCTASTTKSVTVSGGPPPFTADYTTSASCTSDFAGTRCDAEVGKAVSFTDISDGATSHNWSFGDGETASGAQVSHTFKKAGAFTVLLTAGNGQSTANASRLFNVTGQPTPTTRTVVLPWIAQTNGALVQSSDLYVHNPGTQTMSVTLEFRKRGTPEANPPKVTRDVQPGATLFASDVLHDVFGRENISGLLRATVVPGDVAPVLMSFNTTFGPDGTRFGQVVPGVPLATDETLVAPSGAHQNIVGLNDNDEKLAYFGISNAGGTDATFHLRFVDRLGNEIGTPGGDVVLTAYGQRQFQAAEIRATFGIRDQDDYRVEVETKTAGPLLPYGANLRTASQDPSYVGVGSTGHDTAYLVGALSAPGLNHSIWRTDLVLANTSSEVVICELTFTGLGVTTAAKPPVQVTLQPNSTERIGDVLAAKWGLTSAIGVLTVKSNAPGGVYPIVQGDTFDDSNPAKRYGQTMGAMFDSDAASAGGSQALVGLRQDASYRTTFWLFNPGTGSGVYDVIYRDLAGTELGRISDVALPPGKSRQFSPGGHPLPSAGVTGGFTVQVVVKNGKVLAGAQVINNATNDPAYVQGFAR